MADEGAEMITLRSSDGKEFEVPETVAIQSVTIWYLKWCLVRMNYVPLLNVPSPILKMVIEYCKKHDVHSADETTEEGSRTTLASSRISHEELRNWDNQFVDIDMSTLYDLFMAAKFLHMKGLLDVTIQKIADKAKKSPEEIRQYFGIKTNSITEAEEEIRRRYRRWLE